MAKGSKKPRPKATPADIEDAVGLFLMTFGQGVGPLHVRHEVVRAINKYFRASLQKAFNEPTFQPWYEHWKRDAASVLGMMAAVGRMSGHIAMRSERTVVSKEDFDQALAAVKGEHDEVFTQTKGRFPASPLGRYCK